MTTLGLVALILILVAFSQPLFVIMGSVTAYCYAFFGDGELTGVIEDIYFAANKDLLLAIPLFILAGSLMSQGGISRRLIRLATSLTAGVPAGLAVAAVFSCAIFAAISGSSPVTMIAIGSILYPALRAADYPKELSIGVLAAGGTLGIIIPPSIPMIVYAIMSSVSVTDLFIAGVGPGILLTILLMIYCLVRGRSLPRGKLDLKEVLSAFKSGIFSLLMPLSVLGGIYSGFFTATESAAVAVVYALLVEFFVHRELKLGQIPAVLAETAQLLGSLFLILVLAVSLNKFMTFEEIPQSLVQLLSQSIQSKLAFLIGANLLLLVAGCFMDALSAILVLAPLLVPMAIHYGVDPVHFGVLMIVNLEIGYLTPPVGVNLFVGSSVFKEPITTMIRAALPLIGVLLVGLMIVTFWPDLSLFLLKK
jgi:C4-dicarboxylate transporter DctM subunit